MNISHLYLAELSSKKKKKKKKKDKIINITKLHYITSKIWLLD